METITYRKGGTIYDFFLKKSVSYLGIALLLSSCATNNSSKPALTNKAWKTTFPEDMEVVYDAYDNTRDSWMGDGNRYYVCKYYGEDFGFEWSVEPDIDGMFEYKYNQQIEWLEKQTGNTLNMKPDWDKEYRWFFQRKTPEGYSEDLYGSSVDDLLLACYYTSESNLYIFEVFY